MRRTFLTALFLLLWSFGAGTAAACTAAEIAAPGAAVRTARAALMRIPLAEMDTSVRPDAQRAIEATKDRIIAFVTAALRCTDRNAAPAAIQAFLAAHGDAFEDRTLYTQQNPGRDMHGNGLSYEAAAVPQHPDLLAVVARLAIECGDDGMLMLFRRTGTGWLPIMIRRSAPYPEISGANGGLYYAVSPADAQGRWYVATARVPPWCTSAWSSLYYELARPAADPAAPDIFFRKQTGLYSGFDDPYVLRAGADRLQVEHDAGFFDPGILVRRHVETYAIDGDTARRVAPVAFNVRDFVDEWMDADWAEAADWTAHVPRLADLHRRLAPSNHSRPYLEQGPVHGCAPDLHQIEIDAFDSESGGANRRQATWYFLVRGKGPYLLADVRPAPLTTCGGPDLGPAIEQAASTARERRN
jgi:hypothetical protein